MEEKTIQAIKDSIEHWKVDVVEPFKEGKIIQRESGEYRWTRKGEIASCQDLVKMKAEDCPLCIAYLPHDDATNCPACPLDKNSQCCMHIESPYGRFTEELSLKTAEAMVETLKGLLPKETTNDPT